MSAMSDLEAGAADVTPMQERALAEFEARHGARRTLESLRPKSPRLHKVAPEPAECEEEGAAFCPICFTELVVRQSTTIATAVAPGAGSPAAEASSAEAAVEALNTACGHQFCRPCLVQLAERSSACPLCRAPIHECERKRPLECALCAAGVRRAGEEKITTPPPPRPLHTQIMLVITGVLAVGSIATFAVSLLGVDVWWNGLLLAAWSVNLAVAGMWSLHDEFLQHRRFGLRVRACVHALFCLGIPPVCVVIFVFFWTCLHVSGIW